MSDQETTDKYYKLEAKDGELMMALKATREEPVLGITDVANIIKKSFDKDEILLLINQLTK